MSTPRHLLKLLSAMPLERSVRILNLSGDHERVITQAGLRQLLPAQVSLLAGPGCAASICPASDVYQAIQLAQRHPVSLVVDESLMRLPIGASMPGVRSLNEAQAAGADIRVASAPIEAVMIAKAEPAREVVLFLAGFETLLAPLAGMIVDSLPENLSLLICGRRAEPVIERVLNDPEPGFDALLLPGNRSSLTGTAGWAELVGRYRIPAAITGYTAASVLTSIHAVMRQLVDGEAVLENCYQSVVKDEGNPLARDRMDRVFEVTDANWRGVGVVPRSGYRLRNAYGTVDAWVKFPDYRSELGTESTEMPKGCECAAVIRGLKLPADCWQYKGSCSPEDPHGPCMAALDGTCHVHRMARWAA